MRVSVAKKVDTITVDGVPVHILRALNYFYFIMSSFFSVIQSVIFQLFTGTPIYKISTPAFIHCAKSALEVQREVLFVKL
jgi:hypothetical protein